MFSLADGRLDWNTFNFEDKIADRRTSKWSIFCSPSLSFFLFFDFRGYNLLIEELISGVSLVLPPLLFSSPFYSCNFDEKIADRRTTSNSSVCSSWEADVTQSKCILHTYFGSALAYREKRNCHSRMWLNNEGEAVVTHVCNQFQNRRQICEPHPVYRTVLVSAPSLYKS